ncbi:cytosol aminopeptidase [Theileria orientalis strain Shintoku]|uniref:Cytosol aminopeptidase n=1 Tax=Theileria orientalis strain Shintoku TaxID=869250 RepID=J4C4D3_THEOR|nr:cytosol aminopeptidase [Theileria orientalis strain Shintoku]BAM41986.1 cytosol aminopeptidase [Theileria orientalis strain Shintoku]|eukprot:XP_009692287.1 cytosol aminopeptidase [Theileria orientalis strain Shintoku]
MLVKEYPYSPFHGETVNFHFGKTDSTLEQVNFSIGSLGVFHFAEASEEVKKSDNGEQGEPEYKVDSLGFFPKEFFNKNSPLMKMAMNKKFSAGLGDVLDSSSTHNGELMLELVLGLGKKKDLLSTDLVNVASVAASLVSQNKPKTVVFVLRNLCVHYVELLMTNFLVHLCVDNRFKKDTKNEPYLENILILHENHTQLTNLDKKVKALAESVNITRELVTAPPNYANTVTISEFLKKKLGDMGLEVTVLEREDCEKQNMFCYLSVGQGSKYPHKFIHAVYKPDGDSQTTKKLVMVGKGIMFDSGGYNIKNSGNWIHLMKFDMGGLSAVFGAAHAIAKLKPKNVEVHFISASCENMVDANSYRPSDVVVASNGKTVEVFNTDAEGRLTLADALVYAAKLNPDYLLDMATLTGAQMVALGTKCAAFYSNDEDFAELYAKAAKNGGENAWRMPLLKEQKETLKSKLADLVNADLKMFAGSVNAAQFLSEFVGDKKWVHVDMAGPVWDWKQERGTGYGVMSLVNLALLLADATTNNV